ncbi:MAG: hypothetical protein ACE5IW_09030 [bacterium]
MKAKKRGAVPIAHLRAAEALAPLATYREKLDIITFPGSMGEQVEKNAASLPRLRVFCPLFLQLPLIRLRPAG